MVLSNIISFNFTPKAALSLFLWFSWRQSTDFNSSITTFIQIVFDNKSCVLKISIALYVRTFWMENPESSGILCSKIMVSALANNLVQTLWSIFIRIRLRISSSTFSDANATAIILLIKTLGKFWCTFHGIVS